MQRAGVRIELAAVGRHEDAAVLAAAAGEDLRLDDPAVSRLGDRRPDRPGRQRHAVLREQGLAFVFEQLHRNDVIVP